MRKIYKKIQLLELSKYPRKVIKSISETVSIINDNYGEKRDAENDLGGYILIVENIVDIEVLKQDKLKSLIPGYTDIIECSEGVNWTSSLFLLSSDFAIVVVCTEELYKFLIE